MNIKDSYELWAKNAVDDNDLSKELQKIKKDENEIYDRFYRNLEFGTAGLRGVIGAGTNRMNIYTVRQTTQGLSNYLNSKYGNAKVAIAFDSRIKSDIFAKEAACVLAANGIKVYFNKDLQPTPVLSFAVRNFNCQAGIMITASHNPAKYNGYKCYGEDGSQLSDKPASEVYKNIQAVDIFNGVKTCDFDEAVKKGKILFIGDNFYDLYLENVKNQRINKGVCDDANLKVVYTPLNGAGNKLVRKVLNETGVKDVTVVKEQENPDGTFKTCPYPNPELREALKLALDLAEKVKPDLVLATDPDSDRVGIAVKNKDSYTLMTGNEVGVVLVDYILSQRKLLNILPENPVAVKTIVSSELVKRVCDKYNCELINVLTGFKYIGDQILNLENQDESYRFVFGFEESYGYLLGTYVRDKDAVVASMMICEMAAYYKKQGKTLIDVMNSIYKEHGFYKNTTLSFEYDGAAGIEKIQNMMKSLREKTPKTIAKLKVQSISDYSTSLCTDVKSGKQTKINLPKSNVIALSLDSNCSLIVRPSGTEPKIKIYITAVADNMKNAQTLTDSMANDIKKVLGI